MNPRFLGDSYDIVKQSLLRWLAFDGVWATHPMNRAFEGEGPFTL